MTEFDKWTITPDLVTEQLAVGEKIDLLTTKSEIMQVFGQVLIFIGLERECGPDNYIKYVAQECLRKAIELEVPDDEIDQLLSENDYTREFFE
jgi:hypothetical protein